MTFHHFVNKFTLIICYNLKEIYYYLHNNYVYAYSRLFNKLVYYVIGDSHTISFRNSRSFIVYHIGPATAFNLKNEKSSTDSHNKLFSILNKLKSRNSKVILVFGEIDCRIHIYNQYKKHAEKYSLEDLINNTIVNYGQVLKKIDEMGIGFFVYGVPPASLQDNIYNVKYYAPPDVRAFINNRFNQCLMQYCMTNKYKYINIYDVIKDDKGFIQKCYQEDEVHVNNNIIPLVLENLIVHGAL